MTEHHRILGIDYGTKRIGIAVSDPLRIIASGVATIPNDTSVIDRIRKFIEVYDARLIVVGSPLNLKGESGAAAAAAERFAERLAADSGLPVERVDERFTSVRAHQTLVGMGVRKKARRSKGTIDSMAAALILQDYIDRLGAAEAREGKSTA